MTVAFDFQVIIGDNIKIWSDVEGSDRIAAKFIDVQLPTRPFFTSDDIHSRR